jgi:hypothetical protein
MYSASHPAAAFFKAGRAPPSFNVLARLITADVGINPDLRKALRPKAAAMNSKGKMSG